MAIMAKLNLILVSSLIVMSCGRNRCASIQNTYFIGDTSVNQFVLRDTSSFVNIEKLPDMIDDPNFGEFIGFSNASSSEFLLLVRENGGLHNQYNYFCLTDSVLPEYKPKIVILEDSIFYTTLGVHIGSSETEFSEKYKEMTFSVSKSANKKTYEFQDITNLYRSVYIFDKGYLKHIEFGYTW